jgi:excisionase family DNA binding protein
MAKMFYSMEEAAEKLGVSQDELKQMADDGKLQQFRDRDKVMFKRDQVDSLASDGGDSGDLDSITLEDTSDPASSDTINLSDTGEAPKQEDSVSVFEEDEGAADPMARTTKEDAREATGISVFDADEIDSADPAAQTIVSGGFGDDDELALESVGSGSGLLDLTREADDTSLGAELLDEIYPGSGSDAKMETGGGTNFEGIFDQAGGAESGPSGLADIESSEPATETAGPAGPTAVVAVEESDPVGSGWTGGMLLGVLAAFVVALIVIVNAMAGATATVTTAFAENSMLWIGGLAGLTLVLAVIGAFIGKATSR